MLIVIGFIVLIWASLLGAAYLSRVRFRLGRLASAGIVSATFLVLCLLVLAEFGWTRTGWRSVLGTLLPFAAAVALATRTPLAPPPGAGPDRQPS